MAAVLWAAVLLVIGLPVTSAAAQVPVSAECQAQLSALLAVQQQIAAHNARPRTFRIPAQAAQAAAYDAEAAQLNAANQTALTALQTCQQNAAIRAQARAQALAELADQRPGSFPVRTTLPVGIRQALEDAIRKIPPGWTPPPRVPGKAQEVDPSLPSRPVYEALRERNPKPNVGNVTLRGTPRPSVGASDPAYPGKKIARRANGNPDVSPDHIIPLAELVHLPGFVRLSPDHMYAVANAPLNLQWMSKKANDAKSSKSVADVSGVDPQWQAAQVALENQVRAQLLDLINRLLFAQG